MFSRIKTTIAQRQLDISGDLMAVMELVNDVYQTEKDAIRDITLPDKRRIPLSIGGVWPITEQARNPNYRAYETAFGYGIPLFRRTHPVTNKPLVSHEDMRTKRLAEALAYKLSVPKDAITFYPSSNGGPQFVWIPKPDPDIVFWANMINQGNIGLPPMSMVLGLDRFEAPFTVDLQEGAGHIGFFGTSGAGKSAAARMALMSTLLHTSPELARLVILDCKDRQHEKWTAMPHTILYAGGGEFHKHEILAALHRVYLFMNARKQRDISTEKRIVGSEGHPYLIVLIDDSQELEIWSKDAAKWLGSMLGTGRSSGLRVILTSSGDPSKEYIGQGGRTNLPTRVVATVDSSKSASLSGRGGSGAHNVSQRNHQFALTHYDQQMTIYQPHLCIAGLSPDINQNGADDVEEVIALLRKRHPAPSRFDWMGVRLGVAQHEAAQITAPVAVPTAGQSNGQAAGPSNIIPVNFAQAGDPKSRTMKGKTFQAALMIATDAAMHAGIEGRPFIKAAMVTAIWGSPNFGGPSQSSFVGDLWEKVEPIYRKALECSQGEGKEGENAYAAIS